MHLEGGIGDWVSQSEKTRRWDNRKRQARGRLTGLNAFIRNHRGRTAEDISQRGVGRGDEWGGVDRLSACPGDDRSVFIQNTATIVFETRLVGRPPFDVFLLNVCSRASRTGPLDGGASQFPQLFERAPTELSII